MDLDQDDGAMQGALLMVALTDASSRTEQADTLLSLEVISRKKPGAQVTGAGLIHRSALKKDRGGYTYAAISILCADGGTLEARWWRYPFAVDQLPSPGSVWRMSGRIDHYQGTPQLQVLTASPASDVDIAVFARSSRRALDDLQDELEELIIDAGNELAPLVRAVLTGEILERYCQWPAAQSHHGAVRHGLLAHSIRVARLAQSLIAGYGPGMLICDEELVIAAALLHDVGKVWTLPRIAGGSIPDEAQRLDHVTMGVLMTRIAAEQVIPRVSDVRLASLSHAMLAHHGTRDWGSPVEPHSVEAWLVHLADLAEARLWAWSGEA
ncbi:MAG: HD domain-containing protein [Ktedonobacterales bacterium]